MMQIEVAVFATLRRYMPELKLGETHLVEVEPGTTLGEISDLLGLPVDEVKIIMRNHLHAEWEDEAQDGARRDLQESFPDRRAGQSER